jgi:hypothetical protein
MYPFSNNGTCHVMQLETVPHLYEQQISLARLTAENPFVSLRKLAALNDLQVKSADIQNAYLCSPCGEKVWMICGPEFGPDRGRKALIVRALYGLRSTGASFRNHLADCMRSLGFTSCLADQDVWYKAMTQPYDGYEYYAYVLLYVDDVLAIHHDGEQALLEINYYFKMKKGSIRDPDRIQLPNGVWTWSASPSNKYIQDAVRQSKEYLEKNYDGRTMPKKASVPFPKEYHPEMDSSEELGPDQASYYYSQIGVLRWMVELGQVDIITEVSMLASHLALPRAGHLEAVFQIFAYLNVKHNMLMAYDPTYPEIDLRDFKDCDWKHFYDDATEPVPVNAPSPRGNEIDLRLFCDSDRAGDKLVR